MQQWLSSKVIGVSISSLPPNTTKNLFYATQYALIIGNILIVWTHSIQPFDQEVVLTN